jgi:hypothetical protein
MPAHNVGPAATTANSRRRFATAARPATMLTIAGRTAALRVGRKDSPVQYDRLGARVAPRMPKPA